MKALAHALVVAACLAVSSVNVIAQDAAPPAATAQPQAPAYASDPKFQEALARAKEKKLPPDEHHPKVERLARWKHANKIAGNQCVECLHEILKFQMELSQWKDAINTAGALDNLATDRKEKYFANAERGIALMRTNDGDPRPEQLKEAETSLHAALDISPKAKTVVYNEGRALAMLGRDADASAMFQHYVDIVSDSDSYRTRAEHFIENPHLAAMHMAPPFTFTTTDGEEMSLDDMNGKVVLLDFWATWCGPCKEALPEIKKIAKDFAGQPLVVVSISLDSDDLAWKAFIQKNEMTWPQYRDATGALSTAYNAASIPRYFTIDTDGVLQSVKVGSDSDPESGVRKLVKRAVEAEKKKAAATDHGVEAKPE
jgi:thiol-disulfide isomerase/thioredoxin